MRLTDNFTLEELVVTQQRGMNNTPPEELMPNLRRLAAEAERARFLLEERPMLIISGYRSEKVNRAIGGAENSAHLKGLAIDFICPRFGSPLAVARRLDAGGLSFDQLIYEGTWIHLSVDPRMRREVLTAHPQPKGPPHYTAGI